MKSKLIFRFTLILLMIFIFIFVIREIILRNVSVAMTEKSNTLIVKLDKIPQIPWNTDVAPMLVESFSSAVFGELSHFNSAAVRDSSGNITLLKNFYCHKKICYAELNKEIFFHNGREVTAYDIEFSYIRQLLSFKNNNFVSAILSDVMGIDKLDKSNIRYIHANGINYPSRLVSGIRIKDNYHMEFHLRRENLYLFQKMNTGYVPIVPIEEFEEDNYLKWKKFPVGFGKYRVISVNYDNFEFIIKKTNPKEKIIPYIKFVFTNKQNADIELRVAENFIVQKHEKLVIYPDIFMNVGLLFNYKTSLGSNKNFRNAISLALDREKIAKTISNGSVIPEDQMLPNYGWLKTFRSNREMQKQNIKKAKELLLQVPVHLWKDKVFHINSFWTCTSGELSEAPYIQEITKQLKMIGLQVVFHMTDMTYTKFKENDENVMWWTGFDMHTADPIQNFEYFKSGSFFNNIYPHDKSLEELFNRSGQNLTDVYNSSQLLSNYFLDNSIMVVILNLRKVFSYNGKKIKNLGQQQDSFRLNLWELKLNNNTI